MLRELLLRLVDLIGMNWNTRDWDEESDPIYVGYTNKYGAWKIEQINEANGTIRVAAGASGYFGAWQDRVQLTYEG